MVVGKVARVGWGGLGMVVLLRLACRLPLFTVVSKILFGVRVCLSSADYHCFFVNMEFFCCVHIMTSFSEIENLRCFTFPQRVAVI
jgi:hypothetical protein